jgi:uncharacterized protein (TIGR02145 family)
LPSGRFSKQRELRRNMKKTTHIKSLKRFLTMSGFVMMIAASNNVYSQNGVGINPTGAPADPSAAIDVSSTTQGALVPRMTAAQKTAIVSPANGLLIYQTDGVIGFWYFDGNNWVQAIGPQGPNGATGPAGPTGATGNGFTNGTVANQMMYWNGSAWVTLSPGVNGQVLAVCGGNLSWVSLAGVCPPPPQYPAGSVFCSVGTTAIVDVTNPTTGKIWMDRNLGASQVATSSTDTNSYGDLYQWGRRSDGHQCRTSLTTSTLSSTDQPAHGNFILAPNNPLDWRSPQNVNLWQGVNGVNNPCPSGYRLPTETELTAERTSWSSYNDGGAFASALKWTMAGFRSNNNGSLFGVGTAGGYWSSTVAGAFSRHLGFTSSFAGANTKARAEGWSIRCIKD